MDDRFIFGCYSVNKVLWIWVLFYVLNVYGIALLKSLPLPIT